MQKLSGKSLLLVSFTLFSMFFGAGNLIFPPHLAHRPVPASGLPLRALPSAPSACPLRAWWLWHGQVVWISLPAGCIRVRHGVHHSGVSFHRPCLAIPRTASTSFQMLVPLVGGGTGLQLGYSAVFFAAAFLVALRPEKLTDWLGRILCPCLIVLIVVLFAGCLTHPLAAHYGTPSAEYAALPAVQGILYGYQTMDTLAGLNFGAVIALNIRARGVTERPRRGGRHHPGRVLLQAGCCWWSTPCWATPGPRPARCIRALPPVRGAHRSGTAAVRPGGPCAHCGHLCHCLFQHLRGPDRLRGTVFPPAAAPHPLPCHRSFFCCGQYAGIEPRPCCIIRLSTPVLNAIYPAAIVLILLSFMPGLEKHRAVYPLCMGLTALQSIAAALPLGAVSAAANALPLGSMGFGWVLPALAGLQPDCF